MNYRVELDKLAQRQLDKLPIDARALAYKALELLESNPRPLGCRKLVDTKPISWRLRLGKYRVIYHIDDTARFINVVEIDLRAKIYKKKR